MKQLLLILLCGPAIIYAQKDTVVKLGEVSVIGESMEIGPHIICRFPHIEEYLMELKPHAVKNTPTDNLRFIPGLITFEGTAGTAKFSYRGMGARTQYTTSRSMLYLGEIPLSSLQGFSEFVDLNPIWFSSVKLLSNHGGSHPMALGGILKYTPMLWPTGLLLPKRSMIYTEFNAGSFDFLQSNSYIFSAYNEVSVLAGFESSSKEGWRENSAFKRNSIFLNSNWTIKNNHKFQWLVYGIKSKVEIPSSLTLEDFENNPQIAAESWARIEGYKEYEKLITGLTYTHRTQNKAEYKLTGFYRYLHNFEPRPFNILRESRHSGGMRLHFERNELRWKRIQANLSAYGEYHLGNEDITTYENRYDSIHHTFNHRGALINDNLLFAQRFNGGLNLETYFNRDQDLTYWVLQTGLSAVYQQNIFRDADAGTYNLPFNIAPLGGLRYVILNKRLEHYFKIYRSYSIPSLEENLDPEGSIIQNLKPELAWTAELGTDWKIWKDKFVYLHINYFISKVENLIVPRLTGPDQIVVTNSGSSLHRGLEFLIFRQAKGTEKWDYELLLNGHSGKFSYLEFSDTSGNYSGNYLPAFPEFYVSQTAKLYWRAAEYFNIEAGAMGRFTSSYFINDKNTVSTDPFFFVESWLKLKCNLAGNFSGSLTLGLRNITNTNYPSMTVVNNRAFGGAEPGYYYPGEPINWYGGITLSYSFNKSKA